MRVVRSACQARLCDPLPGLVRNRARRPVAGWSPWLRGGGRVLVVACGAAGPVTALFLSRVETESLRTVVGSLRSPGAPGRDRPMLPGAYA
jgi:hypothetical protein